MTAVPTAANATTEAPAAVRWGVMAGLVAFAVVLRAFAWSRTAVLFNDGPIFLKIAEAIGDGRWSAVLSHPYHPFYPLVVHGLGGGGMDLETAAAWVSIVGGGLAVGALFVFLCDTFGPRSAVVGAAALALHPHAVTFSSDIQSDGLYMGLFVSAAALGWRGLRDRSWGLALATGVVSGLAYLTRPEGLGVVLVAGAAACALLASGRWRPRQSAGWLAALALGTALATLPYVVALHEVTGVWTVTQKKPIAQIGEVRPGQQPGVDPTSASSRSEVRPAPLPLAAADIEPVPEALGERAAFAFSEFGGAVASTVRFELLPFLLLGLALCRGRPTGRGLYIGGFAALYTVVLLGLAAGAGYISRRHALPPLILCFGYLAVGLDWTARWLIERVARRPAAGSAVAAAVAIALVAMLALPRDLRARREERVARRVAAEWLRGQDAEPGAVAASRLQVAYYADRTFVAMPGGGEADPLGHLRRAQARYLILDEERLQAEPALLHAQGRGLELLHRVEAGGRNAVVFRILRPDEESSDP